MLTSINSSRSSAGFTLMELLVVMLLLGLGIGVSLTVDLGAGQQQKQQALLLANALELAAQEAVLDRRTLALDFFRDEGRTAYRWLRQQDGAWTTHELGDAAETQLVEATRATLSLGGQSLELEARVELATAEGFQPEVLLLPTREVTPFTLTLDGASGAPSVVTADLMGRIRVDEDAPTPP